MQTLGVTLNNHTLTHPYLPGLSYAAAARDLRMQDLIEKNVRQAAHALLQAAVRQLQPGHPEGREACGIRHAPIWNAEAKFVGRMDYREWDRTSIRATSSSRTSGDARTGRARCPT